jgi:hypothetical protein
VVDESPAMAYYGCLFNFESLTFLEKLMQPKTIKIDNVEYVRKDEHISRCVGPIKIAILDRGFVYVGHITTDVRDGSDKNMMTITGAKNIRLWGTTKGIGELVNGPLPSTKLDNVGTVHVPLRALISLIDVDQEKWNTL